MQFDPLGRPPNPPKQLKHEAVNPAKATKTAKEAAIAAAVAAVVQSGQTFLDVARVFDEVQSRDTGDDGIADSQKLLELTVLINDMQKLADAAALNTNQLNRVLKS